MNHRQFLGYTKGPDGVLQIVPEEAEIVRKIFELYIHGNKEMYLVEKAHEPIIDQETFDKVQSMKGQIKRTVDMQMKLGV